MKTETLDTWKDIKDWASQFDGNRRYAFRGQGESRWPLTTSLARHFLQNKVVDNEWRKRELKMYRIFRDQLLRLCPGLYVDWAPLDVLSLMQHHRTPTRLIDFTYVPLVAAYFALEEACGDSAIWIIDIEHLAVTHRKQRFADYSGPTHINGYQVAVKRPGALILTPQYPHPRLAAQQGCFLVPGHISEEIDHTLIHAMPRQNSQKRWY